MASPCHLHAVGSHVGDQAGGLAVDVDAFVQALRQAHGLLRAEAQFAGGFLLQGGGGERRRRVALDAFALDRTDGEGAGFDGGLRRHGQGFVVQVELVEALAVQMGQAGGEGRVAGGEEQRLDRPVFAGAENLDLGFAVADQAEGDGLHAAGAAAAGQFPPQYRGQGEAHQVVQRAAGHVGLDQRLVEFARVGDSVADGVAGDLVEGDAADGDALQRVLFRQHGLDVPGNRLAFAIRVGGEVEGLGAFQRLGDGADLLVAAGVGLPVHGEILVRADAAILRRQVAHVPETGEDRVAATQVAVDGLGLGGGFDNDNV